MSFPTQMSFRSLTFTSAPNERTACSTTWAVACLSNDARGRCIEKFVLPKSCRGRAGVSRDLAVGPESLRRTWYTVPPPLCLRMKGMPRSRAARRLTSFHGFWFRPTTTHGSSRYRSRSGFSGDLCRNSLRSGTHDHYCTQPRKVCITDPPVFQCEVEVRVCGLGNVY